MAKRKQIIKRLENQRRISRSSEYTQTAFEKLFEGEWEEFVVRFDKQKGEFVTETVSRSLEQAA